MPSLRPENKALFTTMMVVKRAYRGCPDLGPEWLHSVPVKPVAGYVPPTNTCSGGWMTSFTYAADLHLLPRNGWGVLICRATATTARSKVTSGLVLREEISHFGSYQRQFSREGRWFAAARQTRQFSEISENSRATSTDPSKPVGAVLPNVRKLPLWRIFLMPSIPAARSSAPENRDNRAFADCVCIGSSRDYDPPEWDK